MKKKYYVLSLAIALVLGTVAFISGFAGGSKAAPNGNALSALPASDVVITVDTQRLMNETLPVILADNPGMLAKLNGKMESFNKEMGIDLRTFDSVAVGLRFATPSSKDFDAVVIARGRFNANQVIDAAFAAAKAKKHELQKTEEQYEGKTIHVILPTNRVRGGGSSSARVVTNANTVDDASASSDTKANSSQARLSGEPQFSAIEIKKGSEDKMAIVALDANTLAAGDLKSVKAAIDASMGRERVDDELVRLATQNASALVGFSGRIPPSMTEKITATHKGSEGKYMASIRQFYGSFSTMGTDAEAILAVRTENAAQARDIGQALNAMKLLSGFSIAQPNKGEVRSLAGVLKDLSITTQDNEVQIKLNVNQKELAPFIRGF
jgi:hypothetical protein